MQPNPFLLACIILGLAVSAGHGDAQEIVERPAYRFEVPPGMVVAQQAYPEYWAQGGAVVVSETFKTFRESIVVAPQTLPNPRFVTPEYCDFSAQIAADAANLELYSSTVGVIGGHPACVTVREGMGATTEQVFATAGIEGTPLIWRIACSYVFETEAERDASRDRCASVWSSFEFVSGGDT